MPIPHWDLDDDLISEEQREILKAARLIVSGGLAGVPEDLTTVVQEELSDHEEAPDDEIQDNSTESGDELEFDACDEDQFEE